MITAEMKSAHHKSNCAYWSDKESCDCGSWSSLSPASDNKGAEKGVYDLREIPKFNRKYDFDYELLKDGQSQRIFGNENLKVLASDLNSLQAARGELEHFEALAEELKDSMQREHLLQQENERLKQGISQVKKILTMLRLDLKLWKAPKGPGGQDQYAGLPAGLRYVDEVLSLLPSPEQPETKAGVKEEGKK